MEHAGTGNVAICPQCQSQPVLVCTLQAEQMDGLGLGPNGRLWPACRDTLLRETREAAAERALRFATIRDLLTAAELGNS